MAYTPLSWVAGETVTATKMNIGAANMASFNDGTGIADAAILNRHLASQAVTSDNIDFATFPIVTTNTEAISVNLTSATYAEFLTLDITGIPAWASALYVYAPLNQQKITGGTAVVDIYSRVRLSTDMTSQYYVRQTVANQYEGATQPLCSLIPIGGNDDVTLVFEHRGATNIQINTSLPMGAVIVIPVRI